MEVLIKTYLLDNTKEFLHKSKPGIGELILEEGLDINNHKDEIETAHWLLDVFGGQITVLKEKNMYRIKTPDYEWDGKFWELKRAKGRSSIMEAIRIGLKQTVENQGGLILDVYKCKYDYDSILSFVRKEISAIHGAKGYIIIKNKKSLLSILKIKRS